MATLPRADCKVCGYNYAVRKNGTVRHHAQPYGDGRWCEGGYEVIGKKELIDIHVNLMEIRADLEEVGTCIDHEEHAPCDRERILFKVISLADFVRGELRGV